MRISVEYGDPGFDPVQSIRCKVFFQGTEVKHVVTADEEKRYVIQYVLDENGNVAHDGSGEVRTEKRFGHVRIEFTDS